MHSLFAQGCIDGPEATWKLQQKKKGTAGREVDNGSWCLTTLDRVLKSPSAKGESEKEWKGGRCSVTWLRQGGEVGFLGAHGSLDAFTSSTRHQGRHESSLTGRMYFLKSRWRSTGVTPPSRPCERSAAHSYSGEMSLLCFSLFNLSLLKL